MKNNIGLAKYAEKAYKEKWGYVWGTFGQVLTERLFQDKIRQYPRGVGNYRSFIRRNWLGKKTADCVGLIKSYMWYNENNGRIYYDNSSDVNANMMYARASKKGPIRGIPEVPGICVWRKGHIGVYIGNGWVIEAQGTKYGVKKNRLKDRNFTHWLECPFISYGERGADGMVRLGSRGEEVRELQKNLNHFGWKAGVVDGIAGDNTILAIRRFQRAHGLDVDGVFGPSSYKVLNDALEKQNKPETPEHFAEDSFNYLVSQGIEINEKRYDDNMTRGEAFVLLAELLKKKIN